MITLGVIADTHVPDRAHRLHPDVEPVFRAAGVRAILHAGDVSHPRLLRRLEEIAPVHAVRGNRDWWLLRQLPSRLTLSFGDVTIGMTHGHGDLRLYLSDKLNLLLRGAPTFDNFVHRALTTFTEVQVVVFGHIHHPINRWVDGVLLFNPGSPTRPVFSDLAPTVGLLHIHKGGKAEGEIVQLSRFGL